MTAKHAMLLTAGNPIVLMTYCSDGLLFQRLTVPPAWCEMHQYHRHPIAHCLLHSFQDGHKWRDVLLISAAFLKNAIVT